MTERTRHVVCRSGSKLVIGPSALSWDDDVLSIRIDETTVPPTSRIRGIVRLYPQFVTSGVTALDAAGLHQWWPIAPCSRVQVMLEQPSLRWLGTGYLDANWGLEPIESAFVRWDWSRAELRGGTAVLYDVTRRDGTDLSLALRFDASGNIERGRPPVATRLPATRWGIERRMRADEANSVGVLHTLEDTPFYARTMLAARLFNEPVIALHESLSLDRFATIWVKTLLPFRMPRAWH